MCLKRWRKVLHSPESHQSAVIGKRQSDFTWLLPGRGEAVRRRSLRMRKSQESAVQKQKHPGESLKKPEKFERNKMKSHAGTGKHRNFPEFDGIFSHSSRNVLTEVPPLL